MPSAHRWLQVSALFLTSQAPASGSFQANQDISDLRFLDCDTSVYYAGLLDVDDDPLLWTKQDLHILTVDRHRGIVPDKADQWGDDDAYQAVTDLEAGTEPGTVNLIYVNTSLPTDFEGLIWDVERLWSIEKGGGINKSSASYTDVHHLRAADVTVQESKVTRHFGMCGTVSTLDSCIIPATSETGWDTAQDDKVWQPPESERGEIARALLYMDLRYPELTLADCDPFSTGELGYLSQLLRWNTDYPPTDDEVQRNNRACSRWQGNRNPFIDYPDLASVLHRSSQTPMTSCSVVNVTQENEESFGTGTTSIIYTNESTSASNGHATEAPSSNAKPDTITTAVPSPSGTAKPTTSSPWEKPDPCASIGEGNLPFFLVNTRSHDEVIFLALQDISGGLTLYLTDQAWTGSNLVNDVLDEGTVMTTTPDEGIQAGSLLGYGLKIDQGARWEKVEGNFKLGLDGDNIFLYCKTNSYSTRFLSGFTNNYDWADPFLNETDYGQVSSALPDSLETSSVRLPHLNNYFYNGPRDARVNMLRRSIVNPNEWQGSNEQQYSIFETEVDAEEESFAVRAAPGGFSIGSVLVMTCCLTWVCLNR